MTSARELACQVLMQVMDSGEMSHIALREALAGCPEMESRDRRFATTLVQGTLEQLRILDAKLDSVSKTPVRKMKPWIRELLRMSTYQLLFLPSIPASAVCNEAVKLAVKRKFQGLKGFVNGVLRTISRDPSLPEGGLALTYSQQDWLVERFLKQYGPEKTEQILKGFLARRPLTVRQNLSKVSTEMLMASWEREGIRTEPAPYIKNGFYLQGFESIDCTEAFRRGWIQVQDVSSMLAAAAAAPAAGAHVLDVCAAPGGKSLHLADQVGEKGSVLACDLTAAKTSLIEENKARCGFSQLAVRVQDARVLVPEFCGAFDLVMADLPCSGLGTMGHKPEIRYRVSEDSIRGLAALQREILAQAWQYVKSGGTLLYSTCTITPEENEDNYHWILDNTSLKALSLDPCLPESLRSETTENGYLQLLPGVHEGCDGFFISKFIRL